MPRIDHRRLALERWALVQVGEPAGSHELVPASDDASFRRYFRFSDRSHPYVFVDAPPDREDSAPFVRISAALVAAGLNAPVVHRYDAGNGFMMVTDLGDALFLPSLAEDRQSLYRAAIDALFRMQRIELELPPYDEAVLRREMSLFPDWFLAQQIVLDADPRMLEDVFALLVDSALAQPRVFVHRDFHSRNLMVGASGVPGILDFQDAVRGPVTYDLVSLLRDCYFRVPPDELSAWIEYFRVRLDDPMPADEFRRAFDLMGMQRHIKCVGIFSRLNLRDGKPRYLGDIPLVLSYLVEVADRYDELRTFGGWLSEIVVPRFTDRVGAAPA